MMNYYQILGVPRNADTSTLKTAYRKRALESHPDRGGSHEKMLLVNEAWEILSNADRRRRYDEFLTGVANQENVQAVEEDAKFAHEQASHYPREGSQLESWLDSILKDIVNAQYGTGGSYGMPTITDSKTGEESNSGCLFMAVGGVVAFFIAGALLGSDGNSKIPREFTLVILVGGAWLGRYLHQMVRDSSVVPEGNSHSAHPGIQKEVVEAHNKQGNEAAVATVVVCRQCGQSLRIPNLRHGQSARCRKCGTIQTD